MSLNLHKLSDTVDVGNFPATQIVAFDNSSAATLSNVSASATSVQLLALNSARRMATFFNDSANVLFLKFGTTASNTSFTVRMAALSYYELPTPLYTGRIDGIWDVATGSVRITEY